MPKCPICSRNARSYDTLFNHVMQYHQKNDVTSSLLRLLEAVQKSLKAFPNCATCPNPGKIVYEDGEVECGWDMEDPHENFCPYIQNWLKTFQKSLEAFNV